MHYRNNKLKFQTSKEVKKELENINDIYVERMNMYNLIKDFTKNAVILAYSLEKQIIKNNEDLFRANPHSSIYKIINLIDEINNNYD